MVSCGLALTRHAGSTWLRQYPPTLHVPDPLIFCCVFCCVFCLPPLLHCRSSNPAYRPSSDTPLLIACLSGSSAARHHWSSQPRVALHGHALAEGPGAHTAAVALHPTSTYGLHGWANWQ
jgi:hypothetical protein